MNLKMVFYKIINPIRNIYWFIFRPKTYGVKCLVEYQGRFLMIRNTYGIMHWTFPGGGVKKNEMPENAVLRETKEEVGIVLSCMSKLGKYFHTRQYKRDTVYCFYGKVENPDFFIDNDEVLEAKWFLPQEIPEFRSPAVDSVLQMFKLRAH